MKLLHDKLDYNQLFERIKEYILNRALIKPNDTLVVGLSGGPDSVFLLYFLKYLQHYYASKDYNLTLIAAHLDHQWRTDSYKDVIFCEQLADRLDIVFVSAQAQDIEKIGVLSDIILSKKANGSQEQLGRLLRRTFFKSILKKYNAQSITLAHHSNDQEETFFIRLIRGASLSGLAAIRPQCGDYIHPLLSITKKEIIDYLDEHTISYLIDPTNISHDYLRNKIRHTVIPALEQADHRFSKNFQKALINIQESELFIEKIAREHFDSIIYTDSNTILWLDIPQFFTCDSFLHIRLLILFICKFNAPFIPSKQFFKELIRFLHTNASKKHALCSSWSLLKKKNLVTIIFH